jgi:hypothetical protein
LGGDGTRARGGSSLDGGEGRELGTHPGRGGGSARRARAVGPPTRSVPYPAPRRTRRSAEARRSGGAGWWVIRRRGARTGSPETETEWFVAGRVSERGSGWFGLGWGCHRGAAGVIMAVLVDPHSSQPSQLWFRSGRSVGGAHRWRPSSLIARPHTGRMYRHTISATWRTPGTTNILLAGDLRMFFFYFSFFYRLPSCSIGRTRTFGLPTFSFFSHPG